MTKLKEKLKILRKNVFCKAPKLLILTQICNTHQNLSSSPPSLHHSTTTSTSLKIRRVVDQDVESKAVVNAGASTELMALRTISIEIKQMREKVDTKIEQQSTKIEHQSAEIKQRREQIDAKIKQQSVAIDAKIIQQLRELKKQFEVKAEQQSTVIKAKIENQMTRMEDISSKIEQNRSKGYRARAEVILRNG
ncbi:hypothetical protein HELRODRAFT_165381 [Helobdella robusta]|uniref:Uncharacterized protein n=1 Tax=Helobdella robusta TaxID=6412 RepID=T1EWP2_HELRO|nr:hypothetical protein HELRODRAFT_165381 [Helobdella robusta]ESN91356.1 hypothetical protein HELRODRAFT_165381 [Helobdella robusta]